MSGLEVDVVFSSFSMLVSRVPAAEADKCDSAESSEVCRPAVLVVGGVSDRLNID